MRNLLLVSLLVLAIALTAVACSGSSSSSVVTTTSPAITSAPAVDAAALYTSKCAACHGANRQGTTGVAPAINASTIGSDSDSDVAAVINNGKTGTAMPAFKSQLTTDQVNALVKFIKAP